MCPSELKSDPLEVPPGWVGSTGGTDATGVRDANSPSTWPHGAIGGVPGAPSSDEGLGGFNPISSKICKALS